MTAHLRLQYGLALVYLACGVLQLVIGGGTWLGVLYLALSTVLLATLLRARRRRLELDADGLRLVDVYRSMYVPWADVADVRGNAGPWSEYKVVERRSGSLLKLPPDLVLTEQTLTRWRPSPDASSPGGTLGRS